MMNKGFAMMTWALVLILIPFSWGEESCNNHPAERGHSRQKRTLFFNTHSPVDVGLAFTVPLSFALPTFNLLGGNKRVSRSVGNDLCADDILPVDSYDDPAYSIELGKMLTYFRVLQIEEDVCQRRIICDVFTDTEKFKPITEIFGRQLTVQQGLLAENMTSRFYRFVQAMQEGKINGEVGCKSNFGKCPFSAEERLNMPALHFWSFLTSTLSMEFRDEL